MMSNLFIVRTPMQIINAIEAMQHFRTHHNTLIVIHHKKKNNLKQIHKVIDIFKLHDRVDELIEVTNTYQSKFFLSVELIGRFKKHTYEKVFLGLYDSMGRLFLANLIYKNAYLIDDGTATIVAHHNMVRSMHSRSVGLKELRALFFGLQTHHEIPLHFFTIFQLQAHADEIIITHRFEYLKHFFSQHAIHSDTLYLLGQNITNVPIISKEKYLCYIQQILDTYPDHKIIYMPHRSETLHQELYALRHEHFTIVENAMPVELYFLTNRIYPAHVISFFTSALYTLNILFDTSTIESFRIDPEDIENHHSNVMTCQQFLETTSIIQSPLQRYHEYNMLQ